MCWEKLVNPNYVDGNARCFRYLWYVVLVESGKNYWNWPHIIQNANFAATRISPNRQFRKREYFHIYV